MCILRVEQLSKSYKQLKAVDRIDFELQEGEIIGLLGPNGAGKSTTISMIATLIDKNEGEIYYREQPIGQIQKAYRQILGVVPQEIALYPKLTGKENLKFWGSIYGLKGKALEDRMTYVSELIGIKDRLKDKVETYSGGMKRRVNIGAALLHQPEILIMDEPTVGIDPQSRNHILDTVKVLGEEGMSIIYTSHYMEEVEKLCNRIYIMDEGKMVASGTKAELIDAVDKHHTLKIKFKKQSVALQEAIQQLASVEKAEWIADQLEILVHNGDEIISNILELAHEEGNGVRNIEVVEADLETVFLKLTGKALRD